MAVEAPKDLPKIKVSQEGYGNLDDCLKIDGGEVIACSYSPEAMVDLKIRAAKNNLTLEQQMAEDLKDAASW